MRTREGPRRRRASRLAPPAPAARPRPGEVAEADWGPALRRALADPGQVRLVFQPIVDLVRGVVVGYEALARFAGPPVTGPDRWFAAADRHGVGGRLEAAVLTRALAARETLPPSTFLTVNVSPHHLGVDPAVAEALDGRDLSRIVVELTEHVPVDDTAPLLAALERLRAAGARVALDDAGAGYSGLAQLCAVRPDLVKLDRALVDHADRDEVKLALAELLGAFAGRLDAWLLAEGLERTEELDAFVRLGVPLGQGYLLGRPGPPWPELAPGLAERIRAASARAAAVETVAGLVERAPTHRRGPYRLPRSEEGTPPVAVVVDDEGCPHAVVLAGRRAGDGPGVVHEVPVTLRVHPSAGVAEVAQRAMTRPPAHVYDPVVCVDATGRLLGVVTVARLLLRLAQLK